jgi:hypothetical protein
MVRPKMKHALLALVYFGFAVCTVQSNDSDDEFYQNSDSRSDESPALLSSKTITLKVEKFKSKFVIIYDVLLRAVL